MNTKETFSAFIVNIVPSCASCSNVASRQHLRRLLVSQTCCVAGFWRGAECLPNLTNDLDELARLGATE
jgi:hypothetical protein